MAGLDSETLQMVLDTLQRYADKKLPEQLLLELDRKDEFPREALKELYDTRNLGLHLVFIPESFGGLGGGAYDIYRVSEVMAAIDLGIATGVLATFLGSDPITVGGTPEQQAHWMGRIAEEGLLVAYGATEPQAGSDLAALKTRAEPVVENGKITGYRITGRKQWISNGGEADVYSVLALAPGGPTWFIVERGAEGFTQGKPEDKHGIRASNTSALFLEDVFVPIERMVGGTEGQGLIQAQAVFGYTRLMVAAFGLGAGWAALKRAIRYSQQRIQAGAPLSQKQGYTHKLVVPNACRLEAARAYIEWTAGRIDEGAGNLQTEGSVAKYIATEAGNRAAEDSIQALGGYGYAREYMVEKIKRDVRITTIYEGTSEIMEWTIARDRWQEHLKTRGRYYLDWAGQLEAVHAKNGDTGAGTAALAMRALAAVLERCRAERLTRNQHVLFRLGELIAWAEAAAVFSDRAAVHPTRAINLTPETETTMARIYARDAALKVAAEGLRIVAGASRPEAGPPAAAADLANQLSLPAIYAAQAGLLEDMDAVARKLNEAFPA